MKKNDNETLLCFMMKRVPERIRHPFFIFHYFFPGLLSYPAVKIETKKVRMTPIMMIVFTISPPLHFSLCCPVWMILYVLHYEGFESFLSMTDKLSSFLRNESMYHQITA
ncbi:hypothetical protein AXI57_10635 [Bacillus atrophaeus]|nr:hypothetical protein AXI57_10635 [Bacillus atrophaeus]